MLEEISEASDGLPGVEAGLSRRASGSVDQGGGIITSGLGQGAPEERKRSDEPQQERRENCGGRRRKAKRKRKKRLCMIYYVDGGTGCRQGGSASKAAGYLTLRRLLETCAFARLLPLGGVEWRV
jgi:hypothetical protein